VSQDSEWPDAPGSVAEGAADLADSAAERAPRRTDCELPEKWSLGGDWITDSAEDEVTSCYAGCGATRSQGFGSDEVTGLPTSAARTTAAAAPRGSWKVTEESELGCEDREFRSPRMEEVQEIV
jgi:hypothetical protein